MKALLVLFLVLFFFLSCQHTNRPQTANQDDDKEQIDSIPQATAIFWVDKINNKLTQNKDKPSSVSTAKVKVEIDSTGKIRVISYVKPQDQKIMDYLHYRLQHFRVKKIMLDSGFVKPGIQYVQLRYVPQRMKAYR